MIKISSPSDFTFVDLAIDSLSMEYNSNVLKIVGNFGSLIDSDMIEYECRELRIHTPSEHRIDGQVFDMEVQLIYESVTQGELKKKAMLVILVEQKPGVMNMFLDLIDPLYLPNRINPIVNY